MKKFPKIFAAVVVIALFVGMFSTVTFASAAKYKEINLDVSQLKVGYYTNTALTGDIVLHCANSDITKETKNLVDNKSYPYYWSKPYKFDDLKDYGGNIVPAILIDVANGGDGVALSGYEMSLRDYNDCQIYHYELQATLSAGGEWTTIYEDSNIEWNTKEYHAEFDEVTVYKVRILFYDIGDADIAKDTAYGTLPSGSTRFSLSEINLLTLRNATIATEPTTPAATEATKPAFTLPIGQPTEAPTQAPTAAPTQAPTAAPTQAPTQAATTAPTQAATVAPTAAPTEPADPVATAAPTETPTELTTEPTAAPTEAPTEDVEITTVPATAPATDPALAGPNGGNNGGEGNPDNTTTYIIIGIAAAAVALGVAVFFIIKKKHK